MAPVPTHPPPQTVASRYSNSSVNMLLWGILQPSEVAGGSEELSWGRRTPAVRNSRMPMRSWPGAEEDAKGIKRGDHTSPAPCRWSRAGRCGSAHHARGLDFIL